MKYAAFYCEENIWQLCGEPSFASVERRVVFISNVNSTCALWQQRATTSPGLPVIWDYHVIMIARREKNWVVWDLDTMLPLPCPLEDYLSQTFLPLRPEHQPFAPRFRVLDGACYLGGFSSDRLHMQDNKVWQKPPPPWPAIRSADAPSFLRWTRMQPGDDSVDLTELRGALAAPLKAASMSTP